MKTYTRNASVSWLGSPRNGRGAITTPRTILSKMPYSLGRDWKRRATSPPELIAAAHAGSFSMSLAHELGVAGFNPEKIDTIATVTMEPLAAGWRMTQIHLDVVATVARVVHCDFVDAALRAKANCPVSQLVSANISMRAKLHRRGAARLLPHRETPPEAPFIIRKNKSVRTNGKKSHAVRNAN